MPRLKKTDEQLRAERFCELYRIGKAKLDFTDEQCAAIAGVCRKTILAAKKDPNKSISLGQIACFIKAFGWTPDDLVSIFFRNLER